MMPMPSPALLLFLSQVVFGYFAPAQAGNSSEWRPELPWADDLLSKLSPTALLISTSPSQYLEECASTFDADYPFRTTYALIDQPSGLCIPHLFCAFHGCYPSPDYLNLTLLELIGDGLTADSLYSDLNSTLKGWIQDTSNPNYNLPSKVLFPSVASDVIAAVNFAKNHGLEISVKNSGHSYQAASTKANTLLLNMNKYTDYAPRGITDCDANNITEDWNGQPCRLSLAKGKPAVIRVGGGENWDKTYRSVKAANEEQQDGYKYHIVGGAAGTVSPMGWTFQGGLPGNMGGRLLGFGVDQVLQLEMVLPNGHHVKFGPNEWEEVEGNLVPRTTSVTGVCRTNPEETVEDLWKWEDCPQDDNINFDDLWFAVRGGGGGTWGVVLSVYLQLHDYLPYERIELFSLDSVVDLLDESSILMLQGVFSKFLVYLLLDPQSLNMTEDESSACGWPPGDTGLSCYGEGSAKAAEAAWKSYIISMNETLMEVGIPVPLINAGYDSAKIESYSDLGDFYKAALGSSYPSDFPYSGNFPDIPYPGLRVTLDDTSNILIPKDWVLSDIDQSLTYFPVSLAQYGAFGGLNMGSTSDEANALSSAHRDAAYMFLLPHAGLTDDFYAYLFPLMFNTTDKANFPGFIGSNHAGINTMGPLKDDWTKACPLEWTSEEREEKCIPLQEAIYGTKTLKRLESIKEQLDPNYIFDCNRCIGNNRNKSAAVNGTEETVNEVAEDTDETKESNETKGTASLSPVFSIGSPVLMILLFTVFSVLD